MTRPRTEDARAKDPDAGPQDIEHTEAQAPGASGADRLLIVLLVVAVVVPLLMFGLAANRQQRAAWADADERIARTLELVNEHALKVFETQQLVQDRIAEILGDRTDAQIRADERALHERLNAIVRQLPQVQGIWVVDRHGRPLVVGELYPAPTHLDLSDRAYFIAQRDADAGTYVDEVRRGRALNVLFFNVSRRRVDANGAFAGVSAVSLYPPYFTAFYSRAANDPSVGIMLFREDGAILAGAHGNGSEAERLSPHSHFHTSVRKSPEAGAYTAVSAHDGNERRVAYRRIGSYPVYASVSVETAAVRAAWRRALLTDILIGLPPSLALVAIILVALRRARQERLAWAGWAAEVRRREAVEDQLRHTHKMEAVGQLTGGVAHDFNNLLTAIQGNLRLARRHMPPEGTGYLDGIALAATRGEQLSRQLLTFARREPAQISVLDLNAAIRATAPLLEKSIRADITLEYTLIPGPCTVRISPIDLELALLNLVANARDAMPEGGRIRISTAYAELAGRADRLAGAFVALSVSDTGRGMPPEVRARAFEPFFTTKEVGKGTGLGLSSVYGFARQSGGTAEIESTPGRGTTVRLLLPVLAEAPDRIVNPLGHPTAPAAPAPVRTGDRPRLLVVEDDALVRMVTVEGLTEAGFDVLTAEDGRSALDILDRQAADLEAVVTDVVMPGGVSGIDVARAIRERWAGVRVVLTTGYSEEAIPVEEMPQGYVLLAKPYTVEELAARLKALIGPLAEPASAGQA